VRNIAWMTRAIAADRPRAGVYGHFLRLLLGPNLDRDLIASIVLIVMHVAVFLAADFDVYVCVGGQPQRTWNVLKTHFADGRNVESRVRKLVADPSLEGFIHQPYELKITSAGAEVWH